MLQISVLLTSRLDVEHLLGAREEISAFYASITEHEMYKHYLKNDISVKVFTAVGKDLH